FAAVVGVAEGDGTDAVEVAVLVVVRAAGVAGDLDEDLVGGLLEGVGVGPGDVEGVADGDVGGVAAGVAAAVGGGGGDGVAAFGVGEGAVRRSGPASVK